MTTTTLTAHDFTAPISDVEFHVGTQEDGALCIAWTLPTDDPDRWDALANEHAASLGDHIIAIAASRGHAFIGGGAESSRGRAGEWLIFSGPDEDAIRAYPDLMDHDWSVRRFGSWLLVSDSASRYWVDAADVSMEAIEAFRATREAGDPDGDAYSELCQAIPGQHDDRVPAAIVEAAREDLDLDDAAAVARGW